MKRHKVTRKTKAGKTVTYMRGKGSCGSTEKKGSGEELSEKRVTTKKIEAIRTKRRSGFELSPEEHKQLESYGGVIKVG